MKVLNWIRGVVGGSAEPNPEDAIEAETSPTKDISPEVVAEMKAEEGSALKADSIVDIEAQRDTLRKALDEATKEDQDARAVASFRGRGLGKLDVEDATAQALLEGALIDGNAKSFGTSFGTPTPARVRDLRNTVKDMIGKSDLPVHILTAMAEQMLTLTKDDTDPDDYPVADPKKPAPEVKVDWVKNRDTEDEFETIIPAEADPEPNAIENALAASQAGGRDNDRKLMSGEGRLDNKKFLELVAPTQAQIGDATANNNMKEGFAIQGQADQNDMITERKPREVGEGGPLEDSLSQFLRPEVALRKLPDGDETRAPLDFIRKVDELLRDVFSEVKDKYWIMNEVPTSIAIMVSAIVRVNATQDVVMNIWPDHTDCFIRAPDGNDDEANSRLDNANWDDFVGWVSLAKGLTGGLR